MMYIIRRKIVTLVAAMVLLAVATGLHSGKAGAAPPSAPPDALLPGDATAAPSAFNQDNPQMAQGGSGYLVVWEDARTNYNNLIDGAPQGGYEGTQLLKDIYAARLDANGQLVDQSPIVVSQAIWNQTKPQVAWNGQNWLVVWNTQRLAGTTTTIDVMAARVSPAGVVLDSPAIVVDSDPTINELSPMVASDGTNWLVTWEDGWSDGRLNATRVSPAGTLLDPMGVSVVIANFPDQPFNPGVTFAGDEYLFVWQGNNRIRGQRVSTTLQPVGPVFQISGGNFPRVATDGTDFLVTWKLGASVYAARVTHDGTVLEPNGQDISASHGGDPRPQPVWDGSQWFVTWVATLGNVYAARIAADGTVRDPGGLLVAGAGRLSTLAALPAGGAVVAWSDSHLGGVGSLDVFSASISAEGVAGQAAPVSVSAPAQLRPDIVGNGSGYLAVFASTVSGETRIKGQRLDATGNAIDAEPFLIMGGSQTLTRPRVAWNGTVYLVVWEDSSVSRGFVPGAIFGKRVSNAGQVLDATPVEIMGGNTPDVAALGSTFLVVDTFEQTNHIRFPMAVRVDGSGVVLGSPISIGQNYSQLIRVAALGSRWLAVWQRSPTHDNPTTFAYAAFVNADGSGAGSFLVAGVADGRNIAAPDVAAGPDQALISYFHTAVDYQENGDIYARRIMADGTLLDGDPGIQVTSAPQAQFLPSGAWDGSEYVVAYEDYRHVTFLDRPVSDVYATRVDINGTVIDPAGFAVGNEAIPEVNPVVASNGGSYLIGFANFKYAAPFGGYRVDVQYGQAGGQPTPQPTHTPSATATATATFTPAPPTHTPVGGTATPSATASATQVLATSTPTSTQVSGTPVASPTVTLCAITFTDVQASDYFYAGVRYLYCAGAISGYADGTFRPYNNATRGQLSKIVVLVEGWPVDTTGGPHFSDVPASNPFYAFIETAFNRGLISGYSDGTFRSGNDVTRGQLAKIIVSAEGLPINTLGGPHFSDVPASNPFYSYIETAYNRGLISGYSDGTFRWGANATRGQIVTIVHRAIAAQ